MGLVLTLNDSPDIFAGRTGSVVATQRFDSALRLSPHYHAIVLDGVFTDLGPGRAPRFWPIDPPTDEDVARLVRTSGRTRSRTTSQGSSRSTAPRASRS